MMGSKNNLQHILVRQRGVALVGLALFTLVYIVSDSLEMTSPRKMTEHCQIVDDASYSLITRGENPSRSDESDSTTQLRANVTHTENTKAPSSSKSQKDDSKLLRGSVRHTETPLIDKTHQIPVKWPQTDDRIQRAIQEGERIGPVAVTSTFYRNGTKYYRWSGEDYEAPVDKLATVISAFYDLSEESERVSGRHKKQQYNEWIHNFLSSTDPLVFFCEPGSEWADFVRKNRQHAPTIIAYIPFSELTMSANFDQSFWLSASLQDHRVSHRMDRNYVKLYKIWNEKIIMAHEVSLINPFETEHFVWVDSGYYRLGEVNWPEHGPVTGPRTTNGAVSGVIVRNNMTENGVKRDQFLVQNILPEKRGYLVAGGSWGGTALGIQNAYDHYWKTFWFMAHFFDKPWWCLGYEQHVFTHMCKSFPRLCAIQESEGGKYGKGAWHQMAEVMLRDPGYSFLSNEKEFYPRTDVSKVKKLKKPLVPEDVRFPSNFPISVPKKNCGRDAAIKCEINDPSSEVEPRPSILMIVAHPDDEVLWGGEYLLKEGRKVHVVVTCTQNKHTSKRFKEFTAVQEYAGYHGEFLDGKDTTNHNEDLETRIQDRIQSLICDKDFTWDKIITHGAEGEYGHPQHQKVHDAVFAAVKKCHDSSYEKLFVFEPHPLESYVFPEAKVALAKLYKSQKSVIFKDFGIWKEQIVPFKEYDFKSASDICRIAAAADSKPRKYRACRLHKMLNFSSSNNETAMQWASLLEAKA